MRINILLTKNEKRTQALQARRIITKIESMILKRVLDALVCPLPQCRKPLTLAADESSLQCTGCKRIYPVRDGIPILLIEQSEIPGRPGS